MNISPVALGILFLLAILIAGCTTPLSPALHAHKKTPGNEENTILPVTSQPAIGTPFPWASKNAAINTSTIPLLLTDADWHMAEGCGWTAENISESAALFEDNCQVRNLLGDGWEIVGIGYDMNFIGSRCRMSTHPDAAGSCDSCLDAGPTLALRYKEIMTTEFLANIPAKTVTLFKTDMPDGTGSISRDGSDIIMFRNGTVLYLLSHIPSEREVVGSFQSPHRRINATEDLHLSSPNPSLVRPRITLPGGLFPELPAKNGTLLHILSKIARSARFTANGAFYAGV